MNKFWELFAQSVIIQASVALIMVCVVCYLYVTHQEVPEALVNFVALILGFYFGSKTQMRVGRKGE